MPPLIPAPHIVMRNFLPAEQHAALLDWTLSNEAGFRVRHLSDSGDTGVRKMILDDPGPLRAAFESRIRGEYAGWISRLRVSSFTLGRLEFRIGAYNQGHRFAFHLDTSSTPGAPEHTRMLSVVLYYFREAGRFSGGRLRLYHVGAGPGEPACSVIEPEQNCLVVFPSWIGHDVTPVYCPTGHFADSRFALNAWLHKPPLK